MQFQYPDIAVYMTASPDSIPVPGVGGPTVVSVVGIPAGQPCQLIDADNQLIRLLQITVSWTEMTQIGYFQLQNPYNNLALELSIGLAAGQLTQPLYGLSYSLGNAPGDPGATGVRCMMNAQGGQYSVTLIFQ